ADIDRNAKELLGADLVVSANRQFEDELLHQFDSLEYAQATTVDMASMVSFLHTAHARLIRLVALDGALPFYGKIKTAPDNAYQKLKEGHYAMMDETLASQYGMTSGDTIQLGNSTFIVSGVV